MRIVGDSTVKNLDMNHVESYPGMTLAGFLELDTLTDEKHNIIIYSFGTNDDVTASELVPMYNRLKRGSEKTYIILPSKTDDYLLGCIDKDLDDSIDIIETLIDKDKHPCDKVMEELKMSIVSILL